MATIEPVHRCLVLLLACLPVLAAAEPYVPTSDAQVLATVPARAFDPRAREMVALRDTWRRNPQDVQAAVRLARRYFEQVAAEGDPRWIGYAQAALEPWWDLPDPPVPVRVLRALLLQFNHRFEAALADLDAAIAADPGNGEAWSWRTAILMVRADYAGARLGCEHMAPLATPLIAVACTAQVDAASGHAAAAAAALRSALQEHPEAAPDERLWALTRLAETEERLGRFAEADAAFREAVSQHLPDVYLLAAYADFLLDRGRPADVLTLLKDSERADVLLLRMAEAAQAAGDPRAARFKEELAARFDAARRRGDSTHRKEESRFVLGLQHDAARALALAQENYALQREPADARILLEAALAAKQPPAAQPVLDWMAASHIESVALQGLAERLRGLR
jgi:tetratricopeptide (TPR) repeat protein